MTSAWAGEIPLIWPGTTERENKSYAFWHACFNGKHGKLWSDAYTVVWEWHDGSAFSWLIRLKDVSFVTAIWPSNHDIEVWYHGSTLVEAANHLPDNAKRAYDESAPTFREPVSVLEKPKELVVVSSSVIPETKIKKVRKPRKPKQSLF